MIARLTTAFAALLLAVPCFAAAPKADAPGGKDHPLVSRFAGSTLVGYRVADWEQTELPTSATVAPDAQNRKRLQKPLVVEGKVTRLFYMTPVGKLPLEVFRNHEQALKAAGLKVAASCEQNCSDWWFALYESTKVHEGVKWANGNVPSATSTAEWPLDTVIGFDGRMLSGTLTQGGRTVHVLLYTATAGGVDETKRSGTYLEIVEPKAMATGQVTVDAKAMQSGLATDGKVALYGIYFDTGKAELKPESDPQLAQMAALLKAQPALKVFVVGHTDNQGSVDANLALSQRRAQAVAAALSARYQVEARRLDARGTANFSPVAANASEDGRARNRRVELVVQ